MMKLTVIITLFIAVLSGYSQEVKLQNKPDKADIIYKELLADDSGARIDDSKSQKMYLMASDSINIWMSNYDLTSQQGFQSFTELVGKKFQIPVGKKVQLIFLSGISKEFYDIYYLGNYKYRVEKTSGPQREKVKF